MRRKNLVVFLILLLLFIMAGSNAYADLPKPSSGAYKMTINTTIDGMLVSGAKYKISLIKTIDGEGVERDIAMPQSVDIVSAAPDGIVFFTDTAGIYRIEEIERAPGYLPYDKVLEVELSDGQKKVDIHPKLEKILASVDLTLWGEPEHITLSGAKFRFEREVVDGSGNVSYVPVDASEYTTDSSGVTPVITGLTEGTYRFVQTAPSADGMYLMNTTPEKSFKVTPADAGKLLKKSAVNTHTLGTKLILTLQDRNNSSIIIPDAIFRFERIDRSGSEVKYIPYGGSYVTDDKGQVAIDHIPVGEYRFVQVSSAHGYMRNTTPELPFEITAALEGKTKNVVAKNIKKAVADVVLTLRDKNDSSIIIPGATFELFQTKDEHGNPITPLLIGKYTTDVNGQIEILKLPQGSYQFVQKTSTGGYISNTTPEPEFTIKSSDNGKKKQLIAENIKKTAGSVSLTLLDRDDHSIKIGGATFDLVKIEDENGNPISPKIVGSYVTDGSGKISVPSLADGAYYFVQRSTTGDYIMNKIAEPTFVMRSSDLDFIAENYKLKSPPKDDDGGKKDDDDGGGDDDDDDYYNNDNYDKVSLKVTLIGKPDDELLEGGKFILEKIADGNGDSIEPKRIGDVFTTNRDGKFYVNNLTNGQYRIVQLSSVKGYTPSDKTYTFTVSAADKGRVISKVVENYKRTVEAVAVETPPNPPIVVNDAISPITTWVFPKTGEMPIDLIMIGLGALLILLFIILAFSNNKDKGMTPVSANGVAVASIEGPEASPNTDDSSAVQTATAPVEQSVVAPVAPAAAIIAQSEPAVEEAAPVEPATAEQSVAAPQAAAATIIVQSEPAVEEAAPVEPAAAEQSVVAPVAAAATIIAQSEPAVEEAAAVEPAAAAVAQPSAVVTAHSDQTVEAETVGDNQPSAPVEAVPAAQAEATNNGLTIKQLLIGVGVGVTIAAAYLLLHRKGKK